MPDQLPTEIAPGNRLLTAAEFHQLADVPPEIEWFANLSNASTRRAYENAVKDFMRFTGIARPEEFRTVTRAHIIAWRDDLVRRGLGGSTIRHRLASLFEYLCEKNAVTHNPVKGVERPKTESGEGKTPALGDHQARKLLEAPQDDTIKSGVTVLSAVGMVRRNIWSEAQALQCPQRARMIFDAAQGPPAQLPAPSPRRAIVTSEATLRMDLGE
jgi:hypothetical protein